MTDIELHLATVQGLIDEIMARLPPEATRDVVIELLQELADETEEVEVFE